MVRFTYQLLWLSYRLRRWGLRQFTPSGLALLVALAVAGLIGLDIKQSVSYQVFALLFALLLVAIAASRFIRYRLSATRNLPRFGTVGVPLQYRIGVHNVTRKRLRGLRIQDEIAATFPPYAAFAKTVKEKNPIRRRRAWLRVLARNQWAVVRSTDLPVLAAKQTTEVTVELVPLHRGVLPLASIVFTCPDPLGFVNRCFSLYLPQSLLVLPQRYQLPPMEMPGMRRHQAGALALASSVGDSEEFRALREYRPGDSPRKIHWKSWAKLGKPVIKEEQAEYAVRHGLILDTFQTEDHSEALEAAVAIAASFACTLQTSGQSQECLLDTVFAGATENCFTVGRGVGQTERLLEWLASIKACQNQPFKALRPTVQTKLGQLSGCICIFLDWDRDRQQLVELLQVAKIPTLILVVAGENGLSEVPDRSCLQERQSRLHVLPIDGIQEALLQL